MTWGDLIGMLQALNNRLPFLGRAVTSAATPPSRPLHRRVRSDAAAQKTAAWRVAGIGSGLVVIALIHQLTPHSSHLWHNVFQWLYYLPVVFAATHFGMRGGFLTAAVAALGYIPHFLESDNSPDYLAVQYAEVLVLFLVTAVTGLLADREHQRRAQLQRTLRKLHRANRNLQSSREQVRRADRLAAIGQLASSLAHEIRNPLAGIRGAVHVLEQPETTDEVRRELRQIVKKECQRLERLLTTLLDFARPRVPEYQEVDVSRKIDSVLLLLAHAAAQAGVAIEKQIPRDLPTLECDAEQFKQRILNLTLNAIQAMSSGGAVRIEASAEQSNMLLQVRDQGSGIAPELVDKVFDPFFSTKENGTGLGLAVCHQIVAQHRGTITIESRGPDAGTVVSVRIPLRRNPV